MLGTLLKRLDRPLCYFACVFAYAFRFLSVFRAAETRTLVVRPGGMGDLICCTIALEELGLSPKNYIWLIEKRSEPWAKRLQLDYFCYDRSLIKVLFWTGGRFQKVVNTEQLFGLSQAFALAAASISGRLDCFDTLRAKVFATYTVPYDPDQAHEVDAFRKLFSAGESKPSVPRSRAARQAEPPVFGVAGLQSPSRTLPFETWIALVGDWARGRKFSIAAAPMDREFANRVALRFQDRADILELSFDQLCDRIARSEELFSMDGGMVHVASYYGVPTTAVFTSGRMQKWRPYSSGSHTVSRGDLACQPCTLFGQTPTCPNSFACHALDYAKHLK